MPTFALPLALKSAFDVILTALPWKRAAPELALISMSPSHSIRTFLLAASRTILFFLVLSTIVTFSAPSVSSTITRWPCFDLISLTSFLPLPLFSGAFCGSFHSAPMMIGRATSPCSNTTST